MPYSAVHWICQFLGSSMPLFVSNSIYPCFTEAIMSSRVSVPPSKKVFVILEYALRLNDSRLPLPVGSVPSCDAETRSESPATRVPSRMICVSWARTPSSSKKYDAMEWAEAAPSRIFVIGDATGLPMKFLARARSLTNWSISTPWPNASWAMSPVMELSVITSYTPGSMGSALTRWVARSRSLSVFSSMRDFTSAILSEHSKRMAWIVLTSL